MPLDHGRRYPFLGGEKSCFRIQPQAGLARPRVRSMTMETAVRENGPDVLVETDGAAPCYADCDGSGALNIFDYICFGNEYAAGNAYADCDGSGSLNIFDYICFGNEYAAGCP